MSTPVCNPECMKLLLCMQCGGFGLQAQGEAQLLWAVGHGGLDQNFLARQSTRLLRIKVIINECFLKIGHRQIHGQSFSELSQAMLILGKCHGLTDENNKYCVDRADECEDLIEENQDDFLDTIGYAQ